MTSETNRPDPLLPLGASPAVNSDDPTQPAFPVASQAAPTPSEPAPSPIAPTPTPDATLNPMAAVWPASPVQPSPATAAWAAPTPQPANPTMGAWTPATPESANPATAPWPSTGQQGSPFPVPGTAPSPAWAAPEPAQAPAFATPPFGPPVAPSGDWAAVPAAAYAAKPARVQGGVRPIVLAIAIIGTAVLTAGTTYVAVEATHPAASANQLAAAQPSGGAGTTTTPGGQGAGSANASANPIPANGQASIPEIVKAVSPATVTITAEGVTTTDQTTGQATTGTAVGSGIIFDASGLVLTNHHVVAGNPSKLTVTLKDGRTLAAQTYGVDTLTDALFCCFSHRFTFTSIGSSQLTLSLFAQVRSTRK